jgi:hypothetical protein
LPYTDSALFELKETAFAHPDTDGTVTRVPFPPLEKTTVVYMNVGDQWDLWFSKDLSPETTFRALKSIQNLIEAQISRSSALNNNSNKVQQYLFITQQGQERQCFRRCLKIFTDFQPFVDAQTIINTSALQKELAKKQQQRHQEQLQLEQPEPPQPPPSEKKRPKSLAFQVDPIVLNNNNNNNNYSSNEGKFNNDEDNNENTNEVRITRDLSAIHRSGAKTNSPMTGILKSPKNAVQQTTTSTPTNKTSNTGKAADISPAVPRTNFWTINKQLTPQNHLQVSGKSPKGSGTTNPMKTTMSSNAMTVGGGSSDGFALGNDSPMNKSNNDLLAPPLFQPIRMKENDNHAITVELLELRERENLPLKDRKALLWESCVLPETLLGWQVSEEKAIFL